MNEPVNPYASPLSVEMPLPNGEPSPFDFAALRSTGIGLSLIYFGILLILLTVIGSVATVMVWSSQQEFFPDNVGLLGFIAVMGYLVGFLLMIVGKIFCISIPSESGARGYLLLSLVLEFVNLMNLFLPFLLGIVAPEWIDGFAAAIAFKIINIACFLLCVAAFLLFLNKLSKHINHIDCMKRAKNTLILLIILSCFGIALALGLLVNGTTFGTGILLLVLMLGGLIFFLRYANLINSLRKILLGKRMP
jgi:hypothetical protein